MESLICIDDRFFPVKTRITKYRSSCHIIVVSYVPNKLAKEILWCCIKSIQKYTPEEHALWIVDNGSPDIQWLLDEPNVNVILSEPNPGGNRNFCNTSAKTIDPSHWGSYANGIGIELALSFINSDAKHIMTMHQDVAVCKTGWMSFLQSKIIGDTKASGVRLDKQRNPHGVLHVLGMMIDFQTMKNLKLKFLPDLPRYDTGDKISSGLRNAGYNIYAAKNTAWEPTLQIPNSYQNLEVDRTIDDDGEVIYLHLGRGTLKALERYSKPGKTTAQEYIDFVKENIISQ